MSRKTRLALLLLSATVLSGCAEMNLFGHMAKTAVGGDAPPPPSASAATNYKVGKPYQVAGVWYYPQEDFAYDETGIASWYGPDFHAKLTANGETFDQNAVTAAHKTLQMPSIARVTNLENGRSIIVRVNDRGPFVNGRIIDLSRKSAQLLGMEGKGTAKVRVQVLSEESRVLAGKLKPDTAGNEPKVASAAPRGSVSAESLPPPPGVKNNGNGNLTVASSAQPQQRGMTPEAVEREIATQEVKSVAVRPTSIYVQAGSFGRHDNAHRMVARLSPVGKAQLQQVSVQGKTLFRVRLGPMSNVEEADRVLDAVVAKGAQDARVVVD
ncbi:lipoprotein [Paramagnetospirillum caucaseum]|uniref:Endolytic peptidoglycan transglycosylase RlpA n=1 Tax=Paramagnetospirillum caucaseum TaxID=1244869 RepID=M2Z918_9PROT|nr:septal ring lytic transglycosylase RlpA family protein [Paramagnetospirillum caucaseum]EME70855.1 lipoprotein [Paramagnetospirillum caucaseum]